MKCPGCGLENPTSAEYCDCGYEFVAGSWPSSVVRPFGTRARVKRAASLGCALAAVALILVVVSVFVPIHVWNSVASGEQYYGALLEKEFGYKIQTSLWTKAFRVKFYGDDFEISLVAPALELTRFEHRWLCGDRGVYIEIEARSEDSMGPQTHSAKIVYDFEKGRLHSDRTWWAISPRAGARPPASEARLEERLAEIESACQTSQP